MLCVVTRYKSGWWDVQLANGRLFSVRDDAHAEALGWATPRQLRQEFKELRRIRVGESVTFNAGSYFSRQAMARRRLDRNGRR